MRIVVIGQTSLIGSQLVTRLRDYSHEVVDGITGPAVVVDVSDPPCEDATRQLLAFEAAAGVTHHVALSSVGIERLLDSDYGRAKCVQEQLIKESGIPYSIVRATQLFESLGAIADIDTQGMFVRVPPALVQPVAAEDVARLLAQTAIATPLNGTIEIGGPEPFYLEGLVQRILGARNDPRKVRVDADARYFGAAVDERTLMAGDEAELGEIRFDDWLNHTALDGPGADAIGPFEFRVTDVAPGSVLLLGNVAVFSAAGGFCATQAMCTHRAGPLSEGAIDDTTVTCPLHGAQFNIWTGAVLRGPATEPLKTWRVVVEGDIGRVDVD